MGLQTPLEEVLSLEGQDVIETHAGVVEHTNSNKTTDQGVTLEESLGVLVVELEELSGGTSDLLICQQILMKTLPARPTLERVSWIRQISRLLRRPYSPASYNSS